MVVVGGPMVAGWIQVHRAADPDRGGPQGARRALAGTRGRGGMAGVPLHRRPVAPARAVCGGRERAPARAGRSPDRRGDRHPRDRVHPGRIAAALPARQPAHDPPGPDGGRPGDGREPDHPHRAAGDLHRGPAPAGGAGIVLHAGRRRPLPVALRTGRVHPPLPLPQRRRPRAPPHVGAVPHRSGRSGRCGSRVGLLQGPARSGAALRHPPLPRRPRRRRCPAAHRSQRTAHRPVQPVEGVFRRHAFVGGPATPLRAAGGRRDSGRDALHGRRQCSRRH